MWEHPVCLSVRCIQLSLWIVWIALLFICDATLRIYYLLHTSAQIVTGSIKPKAESFKVSVVSLMKKILLRDSG
ncbi:Uncharacterized protein HZ326_27362 [Fusarium oxysporum f. sp. albedinis]|nr:Uncharacterized protein HZ326_27362 [Fusarium oxysporum f. sp. albedinis]